MGKGADEGDGARAHEGMLGCPRSRGDTLPLPKSGSLPGGRTPLQSWTNGDGEGSLEQGSERGTATRRELRMEGRTERGFRRREEVGLGCVRLRSQAEDPAICPATDLRPEAWGFSLEQCDATRTLACVEGMAQAGRPGHQPPRWGAAQTLDRSGTTQPTKAFSFLAQSMV